MRKHGSLCAAALLGLLLTLGCGPSSKPAPEKVVDTPPTPVKKVEEKSLDVKKKAPDPRLAAEQQQRDEIRKRLRELSPDQSDEVRAIATERIKSMEGASDLVLAMMKDEQAEVRRGAAFYLLDRVDLANVQMTTAFEEALEDKDNMVRRLALQVVQRFPNERLVDAVERLGAMLENPEEDDVNRAALARRIAKLDQDGQGALPHLLRVAKSDANKSVKNACVYAISQVAEPAKAIELLMDILVNEKNASVKRVAAARLGRMGADAEGAVEPLTKLLGSSDPVERRLAVFALGKIGGPAKSAIPALQKLSDDPDMEVRELAKRVVTVLSLEP